MSSSTTSYSLMKDGVEVIPLLSLTRTKEYRRSFQNLTFPEYVDHDGVKVMGGFGAYSNPSSFHNGMVRDLRLETKPASEALFKRVFEEKFFVERLFDRMCMRPQGTSLPKESWHRDLNPMTMILTDKKKKEYRPASNDYVIGGWVNLDDQPQYFSCALGTHFDKIVAKKGRSGFTMTHNKTTPETAVRVEIPPGHGVFFFQNLLHQVLPIKQKKDSFRVFHAWRIVLSDTQPAPFFPAEWTEKWIHDQATPLLPSGQHPPMYSSNHASVYLFRGNKHDPILFSKKFKPACIAHKICGGVKNNGRSYDIVERHMTSLRAYDLPMYRPYDKEEKDMFFPHSLK